MKPHQVTFYLYAENEEQVKNLQQALNNFVMEKYNKGVLITAPKLQDALARFGSNFMVNNFLKK